MHSNDKSRNIHPYLLATEYATKELIQIIYKDSNCIDELHHQISSLMVTCKLNGLSFTKEPSGKMKLTKSRPINKTNFKEEIENMINKIEDINTQIKAKDESISVLSGAVLQIAKQCLSTVYGRNALKIIPVTIQIYGVPIQEIIWYGRNHALHFEEQTPHINTTQLFSKLDDTHGTDISLHNNLGKCFAKNILDILKWRTYEKYLKDMKTLLEKPGPENNCL